MKRLILYLGTDKVTINSLSVDINSPGIAQGTTVTVTGSAECIVDITDPEHPENDKSGVSSPETISGVGVRIGPSGPFVSAKPTEPRNTWSTWITDPLTITGVVDHAFVITARVSAGRGAQATQAHDTVAVDVDRTPPVLGLTTSPDMTQALVNGKTTFQLAGTTSFERSPVVAVEGCSVKGSSSPWRRPRLRETGHRGQSYTVSISLIFTSRWAWGLTHSR
jgi:hypothetical protein